jgi:signal transduction histidine kinase
MGGVTQRLALIDAQPTRSDAVLTAALYAVDIGVLQQGFFGALPYWALGFLVAGFVPLAWRRRAPMVVFGLIWLHLVATTWVTPNQTPAVGLLVATYTVASRESLRRSLGSLLIGLVVYMPASIRAELATSSTDRVVWTAVTVALFTAVIFGVAWGLGRWALSSRRRLDSSEERRLKAATEAVAAERRRMARELHDVVSHSVSVMVLQAAGARRVLAADPDRAEQALAQIEGLGKSSMTELRRLLGVLRDGEFVADDGDPHLGSRPGLSRLPELLDALHSSGLAVRSEVTGRPVELDGSVDLSAYRIVQEARQARRPR